VLRPSSVLNPNLPLIGWGTALQIPNRGHKNGNVILGSAVDNSLPSLLALMKYQQAISGVITPEGRSLCGAGRLYARAIHLLNLPIPKSCAGNF
jgi:hypothetical protein